MPMEKRGGRFRPRRAHRGSGKLTRVTTRQRAFNPLALRNQPSLEILVYGVTASGEARCHRAIVGVALALLRIGRRLRGGLLLLILLEPLLAPAHAAGQPAHRCACGGASTRVTGYRAAHRA